MAFRAQQTIAPIIEGTIKINPPRDLNGMVILDPFNQIACDLLHHRNPVAADSSEPQAPNRLHHTITPNQPVAISKIVQKRMIPFIPYHTTGVPPSLHLTHISTANAAFPVFRIAVNEHSGFPPLGITPGEP
jgi:hypothetical protein